MTRGALYLAYAVRLYPTANKASVLPAYVAHFQREHGAALRELFARAWAIGGTRVRRLSTVGRRKFGAIAMRRAVQDLDRAFRAAARQPATPFLLPYLRSEVCSAAQVQVSRAAGAFDLWVKLWGLPGNRLHLRDRLYVPANRHKALNRALALPGATLARGAEVYRKSGNWYARVFVRVPVPEPTPVGTYLGCDVGVRKAVCTSDGYRGPDLRPILAQMRKRQADRCRRGIEKRVTATYQRSRLSHEARRVVSVARATGRGVAVEDPARLIRWKGHAARFFGNRVVLLCRLMGVPVALVRPAYTSQTCSRCLTRESTVRVGEDFWCAKCRRLSDADTNAAAVISRMAGESSGRRAQKVLGAAA